MNSFAVEKIVKGLFLFGYFVLGYFGSNQFHFFEPIVLPLHVIDKAVPIIPWTSWIYISEYFLFFFLIFLIDTKELMNRFTIGMFVCLTTSIFFFIIFPTILPSENLVHLKVESFNIHILAYNFIKTIDAPGNCFPSLHVGLCYLVSFCFLGYSWKKSLFFFVWATAIAFSTLSTGQHYFIDIPSGFLVAVFSFVFSLQWVPYYLKESPGKSKSLEYDSSQNDKKVFGILARLRG